MCLPHVGGKTIERLWKLLKQKQLYLRLLFLSSVGYAQKFRDINVLIPLDTLGNHRGRVDLKGCLFEPQCRISAVLVRDHYPSQWKFAR
jgi:hypothetical protein